MRLAVELIRVRKERGRSTNEAKIREKYSLQSSSGTA